MLKYKLKICKNNYTMHCMPNFKIAHVNFYLRQVEGKLVWKINRLIELLLKMAKWINIVKSWNKILTFLMSVRHIFYLFMFC